MPNLFVSYDLIKPEKNYPAVEKAIKQLGTNATRIHKSLWFVKSKFQALAACDLVEKAVDSNDKVLVIDANQVAWNQLPPGVGEAMLKQW